MRDLLLGIRRIASFIVWPLDDAASDLLGKVDTFHQGSLYPGPSLLAPPHSPFFHWLSLPMSPKLHYERQNAKHDYKPSEHTGSLLRNMVGRCSSALLTVYDSDFFRSRSFITLATCFALWPNGAQIRFTQ